MGKKFKTGKQRRDKFYFLAKETGFRSRSAFKLIQLNRKFEFLQKSRILIDLCAAPGGWLQVSQKYMPVSSLIIGIDLVSIKPIPNVTTHQEDITSDKCKHLLKTELKTWKADVILHDGAPNVGKSWIHDAFSQNQLTLSALKLASEFLTKGGWFITKVFRSKDYHALLWVFKLLFKRVHATKPQASRHESAEIFVVCENYIAPAKIDPKFFNPKYLFEEVEAEPKAFLNVLHPEKQNKKAEGYPEGDYTLYNKLKASEFIKSNNHIELLGKYNEIIFDDPKIENHPLSTSEVKECCKDIKVLGKGDLKLLLNWRKKMKEYLEKEEKELVEELQEKEEIPNADEEILEETIKLQKEQESELKRKKKNILKQKRKLNERINLKMVIKNDEPLVQEDIELFRLNKIKKKDDLDKLEENDPSILADDPDNEKKDRLKRKWSVYSRDEKPTDWIENEIVDDEGSVVSLEEESNEEIEENNPLLLDLEDKKKNAAERWFEKDIFTGLETDDDDDELELEFISDKTKKTEVEKSSNETKNESEVLIDEKSAFDKSGDISETSSSDDDISDVEDDRTKTQKKKKKKKLVLDPEGLALGSLMIKSQKTKRDIIDDAFNRYSFNDENLPDWFVKDEEKHYKRNLPVSESLVQDYKARLKAINARPIKKVIEAKARKKKRALRKLEKARKKAESITESLDMSEKEKAQHIKSIYKKALKKKEDKITYVVAKKGIGRKVRRPAGVSGRFKVVDRRLKKDKRSLDAKRKKHK
ncbi:pre-rRNA processing protein FTSJ3-like [Centruroides sculpturatus]|uniref:pre-rRNA processing protein FTSJ3-like n=1 Tax=Centruroides sculpturatus TaxID=218467 RepID=UPI000C6EE141|nr:pre-rRNA processing protein FTSJ3-like [Centruroides sculpturatus]